MKLPGWFRTATSCVADGVRDVRLSADRQTLHLLAFFTTMPDVGDMVTVWEHRSVELQSGWVDAVRYQREPDDPDQHAQSQGHFWSWVQSKIGAEQLQALPPPPVAWQLYDPNHTDTQKKTTPAFRDGLRIHRNERLRNGRVSLLREAQIIDSHALAGATSVGGGHQQALWVGGGPGPTHALVIAGALRPSVLLLDTDTGRRLLHVRV